MPKSFAMASQESPAARRFSTNLRSAFRSGVLAGSILVGFAAA